MIAAAGAPGPANTLRARKIFRTLQDRSDLIGLLLIAAASILLPHFPGAHVKTIPAGVFGFGVVAGAALALNAMGLILVYRAHRIINFAQAEVGVVAGTVFVTMTRFRPLYRLVNKVCPFCVDPNHISHSLELFNFWFSLALAFGVALLLSYLIYLLIVKRFVSAPRLVLTVATIFIIQLLAAAQSFLPKILNPGAEDQVKTIPPPTSPFHFSFKISNFPFKAPDILTVVLAVGAAATIMAYYRFSKTGTSLRASAENAVRASTVGVNVDRINSRVWLVSGALSATAGLLGAMAYGVSTDVKLDVGGVVHMLAVAVIARMVNLPVGLAAAVAIAILERNLFWAYGTDVFIDAVLLVVITTVLLMRRYSISRAETEQASGWRAAREIRPVPKELEALGTVRAVRWVIGVVIALGLGVFPWIIDAGQVSTAGSLLVYALIGLSLLVLTGWAGQISLGQFAFAAVGGYVAALSGLPMPLAVAAGALGGAAAALLVGVPALKLRGLNLAITTLAFAPAVVTVLLSPTYLGQFLPASLKLPSLFGVNFEDSRTFYYLMLAVVTLSALAISGIRRSRGARALIATRDNEQAAESFGINLLRARLEAFALAGFIAGLAGALFAFQQHGVRPEAFPPEFSVTLFTMAVIGGLGSVAGPLIGAGYFAVITLFGANQLISTLATGGGGLLLLMLIPGGLSQLVFGLRDNWLRRVAQRRGIAVPSLQGPRDSIGRRAAIAPMPGGDTAFEPAYALGRQWALSERSAKALSEETVNG